MISFHEGCDEALAALALVVLGFAAALGLATFAAVAFLAVLGLDVFDAGLEAALDAGLATEEGLLAVAGAGAGEDICWWW
jgi:hypothetical protein